VVYGPLLAGVILVARCSVKEAIEFVSSTMDDRLATATAMQALYRPFSLNDNADTVACKGLTTLTLSHKALY